MESSKKQPTMKIQKTPKSKWEITISNENDILLKVITESKRLGVLITEIWLKTCYKDTLNTNLQTSISKQHNGYYLASITKEGRNLQTTAKENFKELLKELKTTYMVQNLGRSPILPLLTTSELTPVIDKSIKVLLLEGYKIEIVVQNKKEKKYLNINLDNQKYSYEINCEIIQKKHYPNLWNRLDKEEEKCTIFYNSDLMINATLTNLSKEKLLAEGYTIEEILMELEFQLTDCQSKILERSETNE